ncbi:fungal-specific transcription factor domain-containing protein [Hypoxylon trugodes]|uniref:fungal-specific transcription factor domain-containing protein n=1 Tax=Hypoxylon trugodes TaxID=326681 RepID=UPI002190676C|nr:fungal-specific transcription factor domain-containing protein [Hypoxylon trugodes]KAI1393110.1 fungal-specific transcription factor domain-containing protein [Hypoxylon trugodes]
MSSASERRRKQACERCWKRKQKCDKLRPRCTACAELEIECTERQWSFDAVSEDTGVTHASVVSYIESLKENIDRLEHGRVDKRRRTSSTIAADVSLEVGWARQNSEHDANDQRGHNSAQESTIRDTMGGIGLLSRSAMAEPHDESERLPRNLRTDNILMAALALDGPDPTAASLSDARRLGLMVDFQPMSLRRDATIGYLDRFVDQVCFKYPFLSSKSLRAQYDSVVDSSNHPDGSLGNASLSIFNSCLAVAIGASVSPESTSLMPLINSLHCSAIKQLPSISKTLGGLVFIHCVLFLAIFSMYSPNGGSTWHLVGLAVKKCISSGLHKEQEPQPSISPNAVNYRRALFWSAYLIDRLTSLALDRPFSIQDDDITVQEPRERYLQSSPYEHTVGRHLIVHARLISNFRTHSHSGPLSDYGNLCFWRDLPSDLRNFSTSHLPLSDYLDQLTTIAFVNIMLNDIPVDDGVGLLTVTSNDIRRDAMSTCKQFIDRSYERLHIERCGGSFLDALDVFSASTMFVYLTCRLNAEHGIPEAMEAIHMSSTIITAISERFNTLKTFQAILLSISIHLMKGNRHNPNARLFPNVISPPYPIVPPRLDIKVDVPSTIPECLRRLVAKMFEIS